MRDNELYQHLLGLEAPWHVRRVSLSVKEGKVEVWADHPPKTHCASPDCGRELAT